jgi:hypothetical protein
MKSNFKNILMSHILLGLVLLNFACQPTSSPGGSGNSGNPNTDDKAGGKDNTPDSGKEGGNGGNPVQPISCEEIWANKVKTHPLGMLIQLQTQQYMLNNGQKTLSSDSISTEKITFNNDLKIVTLNSTDFVFPMRNHTENELVEEKSVFLELCKKRDPTTNPNPPSESKFDIVNMADEALTVKAGTFNCSHVKLTSKVNTIDNIDKMTIESWYSKDHPGLQVKSIQNVKMKIQGVSKETFTDTELIQYKF